MFTPQPMPHRDMNSQPFPAGRSEYDEWGDNAATNTARAYRGAYKDAPPSWHKPYSAQVPPRQGLSAAASAALKAHDERAEQQGTATARAQERAERLSPTRATGDDAAAARRVPPERLAAVEQETLQQLAGSLIALCEELIVIGTPAGEAPVIPALAARAPPPRRPAAGAPPLQMAKLSAPPAAEKPRGVPPLQLGPPPHAEKPGGGMAPAVAEKPRAVPPLQLGPPPHEEKPRGAMPPLQMAKLSLPRHDEAEDVAPSGRAEASCQGGSSEAHGGQLNSERGGTLATPQDGELTERRRVTMSAHNEVEEQRIAGGEVTREEAIDRPGRQRGSESPRSSATALMSPRSRYTLESPRYKAQMEALQSLQPVAEAPAPSPAPAPAPAPSPAAAAAPSEEGAVEALRPPPVQVGASEEEIVPPRQPTRPPIFTNASASRSSPSSPSASRRSPPSPLDASASRRASLALQLTDLPDLSELRLSQEPPSQRCSSYRASTDSTGRQRRPRSYSSDSLRIPDPPEHLSSSPTPRRFGSSAPSPGGSVVCTTRDTRSDSGGDERSCSVRSSASWSAASKEWRDT